MNQHILLTGATGMLGKGLTEALLKRGYQVSVLARKPQEIKNVTVYLWDVYKQEIDVNCLKGVDSIIHLAGENISKEKWSAKRKKEIVDSRVLSAHLLYKTIIDNKNQVKDFITAAAVGYYGNRSDEILTEDSAPGKDFLAKCCIKWEEAADQGQALGLRVVKIRTGIVLNKDDGAIYSMAKPIKLFAGTALGSGKQWMPWIHYKDIIQIYIHALEYKSMRGVYNSCAPFPVTNKTLTKAIAKQLHRPVWPFNIPGKIIALFLGEMSTIVLNSTNTSAQKLLSTGFIFSYTALDDALFNIYNS